MPENTYETLPGFCSCLHPSFWSNRQHWSGKFCFIFGFIFDTLNGLEFLLLCSEIIWNFKKIIDFSSFIGQSINFKSSWSQSWTQFSKENMKRYSFHARKFKIFTSETHLMKIFKLIQRINKEFCKRSISEHWISY